MHWFAVCVPQSQRAVTRCVETRLTKQSGLALLFVTRTNASRVGTQLRLADYVFFFLRARTAIDVKLTFTSTTLICNSAYMSGKIMRKFSLGGARLAIIMKLLFNNKCLHSLRHVVISFYNYRACRIFLALELRISRNVP